MTESRRPWRSLSASEKADIVAECWRRNDMESASSRTLAADLGKRGIDVSHYTIAAALNEARTQAKILDLYLPELVRAAQIGRLERYLETVYAAMTGGEMEPDVGLALAHKFETLLMKLTSSAAAPPPPGGHVMDEKVEPNLLLLQALREAAQHDAETAEMEKADGLMDQ
jgi:hypothetical protein